MFTEIKYIIGQSETIYKQIWYKFQSQQTKMWQISENYATNNLCISMSSNQHA